LGRQRFAAAGIAREPGIDAMTMAEKIRYFEERAAQERKAAAAARCLAARQSHLGLALEHDRAAERERARLVQHRAA